MHILHLSAAIAPTADFSRAVAAAVVPAVAATEAGRGSVQEQAPLASAARAALSRRARVMDERRILLSSLAFSLSDSDLDTCASRPVSLEEKDPHKKSQTG